MSWSCGGGLSALRLARRRTRAQGFTMIELLVVMAILGVLAAAVLPLGETLIRSQKERELRHALWTIRDALDAYKRAGDAGWITVPAGSTGYPPNLLSLVEGVPVIQTGAGLRPPPGQTLYFLRHLPRDPLADTSLPADKTWQLRSYASPPERPMPGADVFDVRSASTGVALDGTKYADW